MSVAGIGSTNVASSISGAGSYFAQRNADARQLAQSLKAGDLGGAEQAYQSLVSLGPLPGSSSTSGAPFSDPKLVSDFQAIGQALQSGNLSSAQQAFQTLQQDFRANNQTVDKGTIDKVSPDTPQANGINLSA
jgi:hypothetical protein